MAAKDNKIPVALDDEFLAEIDRVAKAKKETRSGVMRAAIRVGLQIIESGGAADVITLDSEVSKEVNKVAAESGQSRSKVLIESIRIGCPVFSDNALRERVVQAQAINPEKAEAALQFLRADELLHDPRRKALRDTLIERGDLRSRLDDLMSNIPEASRRANALEKLAAFRKQPGGMWELSPWGQGLSTDEVEWRVSMCEKHGPDSSKWPRDEVLRHAGKEVKGSSPRSATPTPPKKKASK